MKKKENKKERKSAWSTRFTIEETLWSIAYPFLILSHLMGRQTNLIILIFLCQNKQGTFLCLHVDCWFRQSMIQNSPKSPFAQWRNPVSPSWKLGSSGVIITTSSVNFLVVQQLHPLILCKTREIKQKEEKSFLG